MLSIPSNLEDLWMSENELVDMDEMDGMEEMEEMDGIPCKDTTFL